MEQSVGPFIFYRRLLPISQIDSVGQCFIHCVLCCPLNKKKGGGALIKSAGGKALL